MAERLTSKNTVSVYNNSNSEIYLGKGEEATKYIYKLAQLEDIMERLGINFVEDLEDEIKSLRVDKYVYKKDRDTWKRACELACKWFKHTGFIGDQTEVDYYYQQAKTEGNDEK